MESLIWVWYVALMRNYKSSRCSLQILVVMLVMLCTPLGLCSEEQTEDQLTPKDCGINPEEIHSKLEEFHLDFEHIVSVTISPPYCNDSSNALCIQLKSENESRTNDDTMQGCKEMNSSSPEWPPEWKHIDVSFCKRDPNNSTDIMVIKSKREELPGQTYAVFNCLNGDLAFDDVTWATSENEKLNEEHKIYVKNITKDALFEIQVSQNQENYSHNITIEAAYLEHEWQQLFFKNLTLHEGEGLRSMNMWLIQVGNFVKGLKFNSSQDGLNFNVINNKDMAWAIGFDPRKGKYDPTECIDSSDDLNNSSTLSPLTPDLDSGSENGTAVPSVKDNTSVWQAVACTFIIAFLVVLLCTLYLFIGSRKQMQNHQRQKQTKSSSLNYHAKLQNLGSKISTSSRISALSLIREKPPHDVSNGCRLTIQNDPALEDPLLPITSQDKSNENIERSRVASGETDSNNPHMMTSMPNTLDKDEDHDYDYIDIDILKHRLQEDHKEKDMGQKISGLSLIREGPLCDVPNDRRWTIQNYPEGTLDGNMEHFPPPPSSPPPPTPEDPLLLMTSQDKSNENLKRSRVASGETDSNNPHMMTSMPNTLEEDEDHDYDYIDIDIMKRQLEEDRKEKEICRRQSEKGNLSSHDSINSLYAEMKILSATSREDIRTTPSVDT